MTDSREVSDALRVLLAAGRGDLLRPGVVSTVEAAMERPRRAAARGVADAVAACLPAHGRSPLSALNSLGPRQQRRSRSTWPARGARPPSSHCSSVPNMHSGQLGFDSALRWGKAKRRASGSGAALRSASLPAFGSCVVRGRCSRAKLVPQTLLSGSPPACKHAHMQGTNVQQSFVGMLSSTQIDIALRVSAKDNAALLVDYSSDSDEVSEVQVLFPAPKVFSVKPAARKLHVGETLLGRGMESTLLRMDSGSAVMDAQMLRQDESAVGQLSLLDS